MPQMNEAPQMGWGCLIMGMSFVHLKLGLKGDIIWGIQFVHFPSSKKNCFTLMVPKNYHTEVQLGVVLDLFGQTESWARDVIFFSWQNFPYFILYISNFIQNIQYIRINQLRHNKKYILSMNNLMTLWKMYTLVKQGYGLNIPFILNLVSSPLPKAIFLPFQPWNISLHQHFFISSCDISQIKHGPCHAPC